VRIHRRQSRLRTLLILGERRKALRRGVGTRRARSAQIGDPFVDRSCSHGLIELVIELRRRHVVGQRDGDRPWRRCERDCYSRVAGSRESGWETGHRSPRPTRTGRDNIDGGQDPRLSDARCLTGWDRVRQIGIDPRAARNDVVSPRRAASTNSVRRRRGGCRAPR